MADPLSVALFIAKGVSTAAKVHKVYNGIQEDRARKANASSSTTSTTTTTTTTPTAPPNNGNGQYPSGLTLKEQVFVAAAEFHGIERGAGDSSRFRHYGGDMLRLYDCDFSYTSTENAEKGYYWFCARLCGVKDRFPNYYLFPVHDPATIQRGYFIGRTNCLLITTSEVKKSVFKKNTAIGKGTLVSNATCIDNEWWYVESARAWISWDDVGVIDLYDKQWRPFLKKAIQCSFPNCNMQAVERALQG